ncbi:SDR family NAD(P)-dependent oxidoreductase [Leifsonia kafniensis]|uniref:SDR family NAD(P)-dependent oxidoreductase n=1 Tax=Leifsonia kafniensis TaxID=475957 RepID=A0ABP7KPZ1_9MICO
MTDTTTTTTSETARLDYLGATFDVRGLNVVVTGGGSGLGLRMSTALARAGAQVTLVDREADRLDAAQQQLAAQGIIVDTAAADITDADELDGVFAQIAARGGLHVVFANAGISAGIGPRLKSGRITAIDHERWGQVLDVNLTGTMNTIASAARHMTTGYGRIIATSSVGGIRADPLVGYAYAASKAGVVGIVRNAALELAPRNILVNAIAPGLFETNIRKANPIAQAMTADFEKVSALKRSGQLTELEGLAVFLASPASSFVTGAVISIDGGGALVGPNDVEA